jgi:hypothetical protein
MQLYLENLYGSSGEDKRLFINQLINCSLATQRQLLVHPSAHVGEEYRCMLLGVNTATNSNANTSSCRLPVALSTTMAACNTYSDEEEARVFQVQAAILEEIQQKKYHHVDVHTVALKRADSVAPTITSSCTSTSACISQDWTNSVTDSSDKSQTQAISMSCCSDLYSQVNHLEVPDIDLHAIMREQQKILDQVKQQQQQLQHQQLQKQASQARLIASPVPAVATATAAATSTAVRSLSRAHLIETDTTSQASRERERPGHGYALHDILALTEDLSLTLEEEELLQHACATLPSTPPRTQSSHAHSRPRDRHTSHLEWQRKRNALCPENQAAPCIPQDQDGLVDHHESHPRLRVPGLAEALAAQSAALAVHNASLQRSISTASSVACVHRNNLPHEIDVDSVIIQRAAPPSSRIVRKLSSAASNTNMSEAENCVSPDYVVPEHSFVGAFHVSNAIEPPSVIRQRSPQPCYEDQSTLTPDEFNSTSTTTSQQQRPHHDSYAFQAPSYPPLPATIVADTTCTILTATEITAVSSSSTQDDSSNPPKDATAQGHNKKIDTPPAAQKSTTTYVVGGVLFAALFAGGALLLLAKLLPENIPIGIFDSEPTLSPTTLSPTIAPSSKPTQLPTVSPTPYVLDILSLPQYTVDSILHGGAHEKAYMWLLQDIAINGQDRPEWKLQQRFALATLYYATNDPDNRQEEGGACRADDNGSTWQRDASWLDFDINECDWQGEEEAPVCNSDDRIEAILLSSNCLIGYLPPEVSLLTHLKSLQMDNNFLNDRELALPTELGLLVHLKHIRMANIKAKGAIPSEFGKLTNLQTLDLSFNSFDQQLPTEFGLMGALQELTVRANSLQGTLPGEVVLLLQSNLRTLNVGLNGMEGTLPEKEFNNATLYLRDNDQEGYANLKITLDGNRFTGMVPSELCSLPYRSQLSFSCAPDGLCGCECDEQCPAT